MNAPTASMLLDDEGFAAPAAILPRRPVAPQPGSHLVQRPRLLRLVAEPGAPVTVVEAPAGYGKTTLLSDWAARDGRAFAWVRSRAVGGDPGALVSAVGDALREAGLLSRSGARLATREGGAGGLERLVEDAAAGRPFVLVIDDAHLIGGPAPIGMLADLAVRMPAGAAMAVASRPRLGLPIGRLRASAVAVEVGAGELAMTRLEAAMLLDAAGVRIGAEQVDRLLERTHGWPAALFLAAIAIREQTSAADAIDGFGGEDRLVADYIRTEVLAGLSREQLAFLRRTSILERMSAPLCDAVLDARDSAAVLEQLATANVLLAPRDRSASEFSRHPLLTDLLRAELARREPERVATLHRRASAWCVRAASPGAALRHAVATGDPAYAGRVLWSLTPAWVGRGDGGPVGRGLRRFEARDLSAHPTLALAAASYHLVEGRRDDCERWTEAASLAGADRWAAPVALLRACVARHGVRRMGDDAGHAAALLAPGDPWHSLGRLLGGVGLHLTGDRERARERLEEGARRASSEVPLVEALCHAQLAVLELEREDPDGAARRARDATGRLAGVPATAPLRALVLATAAEVAAHRGHLREARRDASEAQTLLASLDNFTPWYVAETEILLARAAIRLSDAATARTLLARAARRQPQAADARVLWEWLHEAWERADAFALGATGERPALTIAELRVLRFLPSHMSFREIGLRLHVSSNTVKTQALSVYRKLDVTCRSDAVARGRLVGLIDD